MPVDINFNHYGFERWFIVRSIAFGVTAYVFTARLANCSMEDGEIMARPHATTSGTILGKSRRKGVNPS